MHNSNRSGKKVGEELHPTSHLFNATYPIPMSTIETGLHLLFVPSLWPVTFYSAQFN